MFSTGQLIFALIFVIAFTTIIIISYKKDRFSNQNYFKGSYKILISFIIAFVILFLIKYFTQKN